MFTILISFVLFILSLAVLVQEESILEQLLGQSFPEAQSFLLGYEELIIVALPVCCFFLLIFSVLQRKNSISQKQHQQALEELQQELSEARVQVEEVKQINEVLEEEASAVKGQQEEAEKSLEKAEKKVKELQGGKLKRDTVVDAELLNFLSLLQDKGRFIDFVMGDIAQYPDEKIGAAARVVHQGCKDLLMRYFSIAPIMDDEEGKQVTVSPDSNHHEIRVIGGDLNGAEKQGTILHRGWRATEVKLPRVNQDAIDSAENVIVPAEVNLKN